MKTLTSIPLAIGSLALATLLVSCVDPYAQGPSNRSASVTTYRAGYEVRSLPSGYRTEVIDGDRYHVHNGTYYRPRSGRYVVVDAPRPRDRGRYGRSQQDRGYNRSQQGRDVVITRLPRGYRPVTYRGVRYYQVNDVYYQQRGSGYVVVGRPY